MSKIKVKNKGIIRLFKGNYELREMNEWKNNIHYIYGLEP